MHAKSLFLNTRKRKHRYHSFLKVKYPNDASKCNLFPAPVLTRWNSWFKSVDYLKERVEDIKQFYSSLQEHSAAVKYFANLSENDLNVVVASAYFLVEHFKPVIELIETLEGNSYPYVHKVASKINDMNAKCVFQCQPTALLPASGSVQGG